MTAGACAAPRASRPRSSNYLDTLAEVLFQRGDRAGAIAAIDRAIAIDPTYARFATHRLRFRDGDPRTDPEKGGY